MYRLVIADDELLVRKGLTQRIDWYALGFEICGQFEDGENVIEYVKNNPVDVIFSDVQMLSVSGLEVARWVAANCPDTKIVLLSGYKEFDYVREALQANVYDYVLKPVNLSEVARVFEKIKEELNKRNGEVGGHIATLFAYRESEEFREIAKNAARLAEIISGGVQEAEYKENYEEWIGAVKRSEKRHVPTYVFQLFDMLYECLEKKGIYLPEELGKTNVYQRIASWNEREVEKNIETILLDIANSVYSTKVVTKSNIVSRAKEYVDQHIGEDFSVDDVADSMYLSKGYFIREFKARAGITLMDYARRRRMEKAVELIKEGITSPGELAKAVGYSDLKYFQKSFKKHTGYSIREYQRLLRGK